MNDRLNAAFDYAKAKELLNPTQNYLPNCPEHLKDDFAAYRIEVLKMSRKVKLRHIKGYDTKTSTSEVDHKLSIFFGFMNSVSVEAISHVSNLHYIEGSINNIKRSTCIFSDNDGYNDEIKQIWGFREIPNIILD